MQTAKIRQGLPHRCRPTQAADARVLSSNRRQMEGQHPYRIQPIVYPHFKRCNPVKESVNIHRPLAGSPKRSRSPHGNNNLIGATFHRRQLQRILPLSRDPPRRPPRHHLRHRSRHQHRPRRRPDPAHPARNLDQLRRRRTWLVRRRRAGHQAGRGPRTVRLPDRRGRHLPVLRSGVGLLDRAAVQAPCPHHRAE